MGLVNKVAGSIILTLLASAMAWVVYMAVLANNGPVKNGKLANGRILKCTTSRRSDNVAFNYGFEHNGHTIVTITFSFAGQFTMADCNQYFVGRSFPVMYDSTHAANNEILIDSISFKRYRLPFPDSQVWIYNHLRGQDDPGT